MKAIHALLLAGLLLAGCADPQPPSDNASSQAPTGTRSGSVTSTSTTAPIPEALVDTLHFDDAPKFNARRGSTDRASQFYTFADSLVGTAPFQPSPSWTLRLNETRELRAINMTLWVELQGTAVAPPTTADCFWRVNIDSEAIGQGTFESAVACGAEPPGPVAAGTRRLDLASDISGLTVDANHELSFTIFVNGMLGPDATARLLYGGPSTDSQVTLPGLRAREGSFL